MNSYTNNYMIEGLFARAQYDYKEKYFVSTSVRRDASSHFAKGHRWGTFYSFGAAWNIAKEGFMDEYDWVDLLKLKASYGEQDNMNDAPKEYGYYGWMGDIQGWIDAINSPVFGGGSAETKVNSPTIALKFRPYTYSKSCHPAEFEPYGEYACKGEDCSILQDNPKADNIKGFGGDKCLNFVFGLNANDLMMPALVVDVENKVAYHINSEPRFMIEYERLKWVAKKVNVGKDSYTDYAGNFLRWDVDDNADFGAKSACEKICYDRKAEYKKVKGGYIDT